MNRLAILLTFAVLPMAAAAQQDPSERLAEVLPPDIAARVLEHIEAARSRSLPASAIANVALEGVAKGRSADHVLASVVLLVADIGLAQEALGAAGRAPANGEVEAATAAMRMGVDAAEISELASSQPSGRALAVPLLVMGGLTSRGLPSDEALAAVRERLGAGADDTGLLGEFPEVGQQLASGLGPDQVGPALASGFAGFQVPASGVTVPVEQPNARGPGRGGA